MKISVGIDVSKKNLDVYINNCKKRIVIWNNKKDLKNLAKELQSLENCLVVLESTGSYHKLAWKELDKKGIPVSIVNPKRIRDFGKSLGRLAKTDKLDSELISKFGEIMEVTPTAYCSEEEEELQDYLSRRDQRWYQWRRIVWRRLVSD